MREAGFLIGTDGQVVSSWVWQDRTRRCPFLLPVQDGYEVITVDLDAAGIREPSRDLGRTRATIVTTIPAEHCRYAHIRIRPGQQPEGLLRRSDGRFFRRRSPDQIEQVEAEAGEA